MGEDNVLTLDEARARKAARDEEAEMQARLEQLHRVRIMFYALVRPTGRVRIKREDLEAAERGGRISVKVHDNGDLVVSFV
jgi:hypothetical protein